MTITFKCAVTVAIKAMVLQMLTYSLLNHLYKSGTITPKTKLAHQKYEQLTEAIELFKTLVVPSSAPAGGPDDTKLERNTP
jgi:hypothetical protein